MIPTRITLSRYECARSLGISVRLLDKCIKDGRINVVRLGDRVLVPHSELVKLAKSNSGLNSKKTKQREKDRSRILQAARRRKVGQ
jgi:excisionase family DNA binding protein